MVELLPLKGYPYTLKVGSFSFECIIILLIYFINCQKALFYKEMSNF